MVMIEYFINYLFVATNLHIIFIILLFLQKNVMDNIIKNNRITSLDALRAFALWGILITHTTQLFNFNNSYNDISFFSSDSITLFKYLLFLFSGRFKIIFSILFGVSFYLLLKNPQYSNIKFLWRLTLLMGFGLLNKLFYTTEILFWYGLCGVILLLFRGMTIKRLLVWFVSLYMSFILFNYLFQDNIYSYHKHIY